MITKVTKRVVAIALILSLALSAAVVAPSGTSDAAKKLKIKKKASVSVGKTVTIKANKKAKWSVKPSNIAKISGKKSGKKAKIEGFAKGKATVTAKAGKEKATCVVTVKDAAKGTLIYNMATETGTDATTGKSYAPPQKCNYNEFRWSTYAIWLCRATFYDPVKKGRDFRGRKIHGEVTFQNTGRRDLPELGFSFNYTKGGTDGSYPFALHINAKGLAAKVKKDAQHRHCKIVKAKIKKGKTYTYSFDFVIPKNAMNGDKDPETNKNYPIMFFLANLKDSSPYKPGDEVTIKKCRFTVA